jgi:ABC-type dipeptide/oligopeptide/nickel transport system permease component
MRKFLLNRVLLLILTLLGVVSLVFFTVHLIPGDPVEIMMGETALPSEKEQLRQNLGLDKPLSEQYINYLSGLGKGRLGISIHSRAPVLAEIASRWPATIELSAVALALSSLLGISLGVICAAKKDGWLDKISLACSLVGVALPNFLIGPVLIIIFSIWLGWLPISGRNEPLSLVLPALTLASGMSALIFRITRSSMLDVLAEDFIKNCRARGMPEWKILSKHALSNAMLPIITSIGLQTGALLSGAVIAETIFAWPGIGRLLVQAIETRDYPLVQGCVLNIAFLYIIVNFMTEFAYSVFDPRIRLDK